MSLRTRAALDFQRIIENQAHFGWPITLTDPAGVSKALVGLTNDIGQTIDPETGQIVSGRTASIVLSIKSIKAAGLSLPVGVSDSASSPWTVQFNDTSLNSYLFKISRTEPDRTLEVVSCFLKFFKAAV